MTASTQTAPTGIILFAHGSRDPLWKLPIEAVAARIRERAVDAQVACAYLELTTPDLPSVAAQMITSGAMTLRIVPMFLGVGRHAREDLPVLVTQLQADHPQVHFELQAAVGENPLLIDLMAQIAIDP
jgi:sirohydrochlorin cobaltochelatase